MVGRGAPREWGVGRIRAGVLPAAGWTMRMDGSSRRDLEDIIGHRFERPELLDQALTHASMTASRLESNERLEFLGDAVLGVVVCEQIYRMYPDLLEGEMTKIKSLVVSRQTCAAIAQELNLERYLVLGKGMKSSAPLPSSLSAAALESVLGAIYLDGGFAAAEKFIKSLVLDLIERAAESGHQENFKSVLQQHAQQMSNHMPVYRILDEQGPDHAKCFKICVEIDGRRFEPCWGQSKKRAEQEAALNALRELGVITEDGDEVRVLPPNGK